MIVIPENGVYSQKYHGSKHHFLHILELQFGGYTSFSDTHIHFLILNDSTIQIAGDTYSRPIPHHMKVKTQQTMVTRFHMTKAGSEQNASEGNQCSALRRWIFGLIR